MPTMHWVKGCSHEQGASFEEGENNTINKIAIRTVWRRDILQEGYEEEQQHQVQPSGGSLA